eukprot:2503540-Lingulodinium_polyedra.AAC.1
MARTQPGMMPRVAKTGAAVAPWARTYRGPRYASMHSRKTCGGNNAASPSCKSTPKSTLSKHLTTSRK